MFKFECQLRNLEENCASISSAKLCKRVRDGERGPQNEAIINEMRKVSS